MANIIKKTEPATEVITHDVSPLTVNTDASAYARLGWLIVLVGVLGFLVWAVFAPLDKGVPLPGTVAKESNRKTVQYQQGGIVQDILVKDGDRVKAGQVLVRMNDVQQKSAADVTMAQYLGTRATEARLLAELAGQSTVALPATLQEYKNEPRMAEIMALQNQLISSRQGALRNELGSMDENIAGLRSQLTGTQESRENKKEQLAILKEQRDNIRELAKDGYIARNRLLDMERTYSQVSGSISEDLGNIGRLQRQVMEVTMRKAQRGQEYQKEVRSLLSDVQKEANALQGRLEGQKSDLANVEVKAPADGVVVGSSVFTKGGVVAPGAHMMEIVPSGDALVIEGQLPVNLVDKVHAGLPVELIFSAFNSNSTPHIAGEVTQVAADRTVDERTGSAYYKVRTKVTPAGLKMIADMKLVIIPGMPVEMFVKTGERSMMNYLLKPVLDRSKSSMTEE